MSTNKHAVALKPQIIASLKSKVRDAASEMPDLTGKDFVMGFWHNWPAADSPGYQGGRFQEMSLTDIPEQYNVVAVAFMKGKGIPTFKPYNVTDEEFRRQIGVLNAQGRAVLISLGGADADIELIAGQEEALSYELIRLVETYGFDGLDIDLEQAAIDKSDNQTVIPTALRLVKDHYKTEGKNFIVSMAPEFPYLKPQGKYEPYIDRLEGYYDFIVPQYYNQGGDGIWSDELNAWIAQDNDELKEEFLYCLTDSILNGTGGYKKIPHDKFAIGLPSNNDAAATGYVINPQDALNALTRLKEAKQPIRGLMTWSVNWDAGFNSAGKPYDWEFIKRYGHISAGGGELPEKPQAPADFHSPTQTESTIRLQWAPSISSHPITFYTLYRDGQALPKNITNTDITDSGLTADTGYQYQVSATDSQGKTSERSSTITVRTLSSSTPANEWKTGTWYEIGDQVSWQDKTWRCLAKHTSRAEWTPSSATTLWETVNGGAESR